MTSHRVTAHFTPDDEAPLMPPAPSKSKSHSNVSRQVDLTQEAEDDTLNSIMNTSKAKFPEPIRMPAQPEASDHGWDDAGGDDDDEGDDDVGDEDGFDDPFSRNANEDMVANAEKIKAKKLDFLYKLYRLSQETGVVIPAHISIKTPLDEIEAEHSKIVYDLGVRKSIRLQRRMLLGLFSSIEMANEMSGGPDELNGVSRTMFASISDYDAPFTEMYERYGSKVKVHPLVQIILLSGSTVAQHCYAKAMQKHQTEQDKAKAQAETANHPDAAQRHMRDMEQRYAAEERARDARAAQAQAEARRQNEAAAVAARQRQVQTEDILNQQPVPGNVVTPSAYGLQQRPAPQIVPPRLSEPPARPAPGEYVMRGPGAAGRAGTTTAPASVGILSEIAAAQSGPSLVTPVPVVLTPVSTSFQALPDNPEPPTPTGKKPAARKKAAKKKDADDVAFN